MLIRFNVKNFLSFSANAEGRSEEFSMIAGKVRSKKEHVYDNGKIKLLKLAAVYGANASGKSNLVKALDFMKQTVIKGLPDGYSNKYCKSNESNRDIPSYFEIELKLGEKYYAYGFEVLLNQGEFQSEWLVELTSDNKEKTIFTRDIKQSVYELGNDLSTKELGQKMNNYAEDIQDDGSTLFLTVMNHNKKNLYLNYKGASILQDVYLWLKKGLDINYPDRPISNYSYMASMENVDEICDMIAAFGTGITDYKLVEVPVENVLAHIPNEAQTQMLKRMERYYSAVQNMIDHKISEDNNVPENTGIIMRSNRDFFILQIKGQKLVCQTIQFEHNKNDILFELSEESDGTVRILDLLEILLSDEGKTYVVDELDRCLHPSLTYKFIETYLKLAAKKNLQLIVTTHESRLLDFDLLRRDEIWFIDKRNTGESDIYSLEEYNTRYDQKIDKAYLEGRYGGVPVFNTIFPVKEV